MFIRIDGVVLNTEPIECVLPKEKVIKNVNQDIVRVFDCQSKSYKSFKLSSVTEFVGNNKVLK